MWFLCQPVLSPGEWADLVCLTTAGCEVAMRVNGWAVAVCCHGSRIQCWPWLQLCDLFTGLSLWWSCVLLQCLQGVKLFQEGDGWEEYGVLIMVCWYLPHEEFGGGIFQLQEYWPNLTCTLGGVLVNDQVLDAHTVVYSVLKVKVSWPMSLRTL